MHQAISIGNELDEAETIRKRHKKRMDRTCEIEDSIMKEGEGRKVEEKDLGKTKLGKGNRDQWGSSDHHFGEDQMILWF